MQKDTFDLNFLLSKLKLLGKYFMDDWKNSTSTYRVVVVILYGLTVAFVLFMFGYDFFKDTEGFLINIYTSAIGFIITIMVIDALAKIRAESQTLQKLIFQLGSPNNLIATEAARMLRDTKYHNDGSLVNAKLIGANLRGADLSEFNLKGAFLQGSDLSETNLRGTNLSQSRLAGANLSKSILRNTDLSGSDVTRANFIDADILNIKDSGVDWEETIHDKLKE